MPSAPKSSQLGLRNGPRRTVQVGVKSRTNGAASADLSPYRQELSMEAVYDFLGAGPSSDAWRTNSNLTPPKVTFSGVDWLKSASEDTTPYRLPNGRESLEGGAASFASGILGGGDASQSSSSFWGQFTDSMTPFGTAESLYHQVHPKTSKDGGSEPSVISRVALGFARLSRVADENSFDASTMASTVACTTSRSLGSTTGPDPSSQSAKQKNSSNRSKVSFVENPHVYPVDVIDDGGSEEEPAEYFPKPRRRKPRVVRVVKRSAPPAAAGEGEIPLSESDSAPALDANAHAQTALSFLFGGGGNDPQSAGEPDEPNPSMDPTPTRAPSVGDGAAPPPLKRESVGTKKFHRQRGRQSGTLKTEGSRVELPMMKFRDFARASNDSWENSYDAFEAKLTHCCVAYDDRDLPN